MTQSKCYGKFRVPGINPGSHQQLKLIVAFLCPSSRAGPGHPLQAPHSLLLSGEPVWKQILVGGNLNPLGCRNNPGTNNVGKLRAQSGSAAPLCCPGLLFPCEGKEKQPGFSPGCTTPAPPGCCSITLPAAHWFQFPPALFILELWVCFW